MANAFYIGFGSAQESLQHLAHHAALSLAPAGALESGGKVWGEAEEGEG